MTDEIASEGPVSVFKGASDRPGAIVKPSCSVVLPFEPLFIRNGDGREKQGCERNAAKRYLEDKAERLRELKPAFLGDDLYASHAISRIFQPGWNSRNHLEYRYAWVR